VHTTTAKQVITMPVARSLLMFPLRGLKNDQPAGSACAMVQPWSMDPTKGSRAIVRARLMAWVRVR
jgi:hypothetical protein